MTAGPGPRHDRLGFTQLISRVMPCAIWAFVPMLAVVVVFPVEEAVSATLPVSDIFLLIWSVNTDAGCLVDLTCI